MTKNPYNYKLNDVGEPTKYLGAEIGKFTVGNKNTWYVSGEAVSRKCNWRNITDLGQSEQVVPKWTWDG